LALARASAFGCKRSVVFQVSGNISNPFQTLFYLRWIGETGTDTPPNPCDSAWESQMICQFCNYRWIAVRIEKRKCKGQPLPTRSYRDDVQQKDEYVVGVSGFRRKRSVVDDLEVNQSGPAAFLIINDVCRGRVAMRPRTVEFLAPKLMRAPKFGSRGL
jgi:hypothetical protein